MNSANIRFKNYGIIITEMKMNRATKAVLTFGMGLKGFEVTVYTNSYDISEPYKDKGNPPNSRFYIKGTGRCNP